MPALAVCTDTETTRSAIPRVPGASLFQFIEELVVRVAGDFARPGENDAQSEGGDARISRRIALGSRHEHAFEPFGCAVAIHLDGREYRSFDSSIFEHKGAGRLIRVMPVRLYRPIAPNSEIDDVPPINDSIDAGVLCDVLLHHRFAPDVLVLLFSDAVLLGDNMLL